MGSKADDEQTKATTSDEPESKDDTAPEAADGDKPTDKDTQDTSAIIDSLLAPYAALVKKGVAGISLSPDLFVLEEAEQYEKNFMADRFSEKLAFEGLLVAKLTPDSLFEDLLFAGTDLFVVANSPMEALTHLKKSIQNGSFTKKDLDERVHKILLAKKWIYNTENGQLPSNQPPIEGMRALQASLVEPDEENISLENNGLELPVLQEHFKKDSWSTLSRKLYQESMYIHR